MLTSIEIRPVRTRRDFITFIQLPRRLYSGIPGYCAPLDHERRQLFDPKRNAFFKHGEAQYWLAIQDGVAVGRISAQIDHLHAEVGEPDLGMFGALDAIDDTDVTHRLLEQATSWLASRGKTRVRGPFNLSVSSESGLLVEGFQEPAMVLFPWNPDYLQRHLMEDGWQIERELMSFVLDRSDLSKHKQRLSDYRAVLPDQFSVRQLNPRAGLDEFRSLGEIYNLAWRDNWGFVPLTEDDIIGLHKNLKPILGPDSGVVIEEDGRPVAFSITIPNVMDYVRDFDGKLNAINTIKLLLRIRRRQFDTARNVLIGILPDYQGGAIGSAMLMTMLMDYGRLANRYQAKRLELGWIVEDNRRTLAAIKFFGGRLSRRYKVFHKALAVPNTIPPISLKEGSMHDDRGEQPETSYT